MKLSLLMGALTLILSGCGGGAGLRMTTDGQTFSAIDRETVGQPCKSPARVCVLDTATGGFMGSVNVSRTRIYQTVFASAGQTALSPAACDVGVRFPNTWNDSVEVVDPYGKFLARIDVGAALHGAKTLCRALAEGGALAGKVTLGRAVAAAPAAAPAPSNAVSREELAQMIASIKSAQAPAAPAPRVETVAPRFSSPERPDDLAVIVGIESYSDIAAKAPYAENDAEAFKSYVRALGVPERNVVLLKGSKAGRASLVKNLEVWLPRMAKADSRVYVYFSGHGAPDVKSGQAYLVPWDGDPNFLDATAYPVSRLYQKLAALPAKRVLVAMDSCFSGAGGRSVLASGARPLVGKVDTGVPDGKLTVLAASASDQISGSLDDKAHGAFTYFLLEGLNAGKTTPKALAAYLTPRVQDEARRLNRDQTPQLQGDGDWSLRVP